MSFIQSIDSKVFNYFCGHQSDWGQFFFRDITSFGSPTGSVLGMFVFIVVLLSNRHFELALCNSFIFIGGVSLCTLLKVWIDRPRPPLPYNPDIHGAPMTLIPLLHFPSMPSGHTLAATLLYGMIAIDAEKAFPALQSPATAFLFLFPVLVAASRVYLGAHWLSDVVAGYLIGLVIVLGYGFYF